MKINKNLLIVAALFVAGYYFLKGRKAAAETTCPDGYQLDDTGTCVLIHEGVKVAWASGLGDVNQDGWVSQADIDMIKAIILGKIIPTTVEFARADCNKDGVISMTDASYIKAILDGRWVPES